MNWAWLLQELVALGVAGVSAYLKSKGEDVSPQDMATKADRYLGEHNAALAASEKRYLDEFHGSRPSDR
jgi:hypothetical protein